MASITSNFDDHIEDTNVEERPDEEEEESRRNKRRRLNQDQSSSSSNNNNNSNKNDINQIRWRSATEQQTYSSKLIEALRHVRRRSSHQPSTVTARGRTVRETAYKVLAIAAKGRTRWSRAILTNRVKLRLRYQHKKAKSPESKVAATVAGGLEGGSRKLLSSSSSSSSRMMITGAAGGGKKKKLLPELEKRVQVLGRLVPGCGKLPFPNLLEEVTDYISALEMQVRAMSALAGLLSSARSDGGAAAAAAAGTASTSAGESDSGPELGPQDEVDRQQQQ